MNIKRIAVTIATTLALTGGMMIMAQPAEAAHVYTWHHLAGCESGHDWSANTGNGYYGGLQFSLSTWLAYGGRKFAYLPSDAGKRQQIRIATKVMHATDGHPGQAWSAWPSCKVQLGLNARDKRGKPVWAWW